MTPRLAAVAGLVVVALGAGGAACVLGSEEAHQVATPSRARAHGGSRPKISVTFEQAPDVNVGAEPVATTAAAGVTAAAQPSTDLAPARAPSALPPAVTPQASPAPTPARHRPTARSRPAATARSPQALERAVVRLERQRETERRVTRLRRLVGFDADDPATGDLAVLLSDEPSPFAADDDGRGSVDDLLGD